jgi:hypothetical protein
MKFKVDSALADLLALMRFLVIDGLEASLRDK